MVRSKIAFIGNEYNPMLHRMKNGAKANKHDTCWVDPSELTAPPQYSKVIDADCVVMKGFSPEKRAFARECNAHNIAVLVVDAGHLNRNDDYWQIGLNNLNWVTERKCLPDRFDRLGHAIVGLPPRDRDYILLCGQVPGDAQHPIKDQKVLQQHYKDTVFRIKECTSKPVFFRPHPGFNRGWDAAPSNVHTLLSVLDPLEKQLERAVAVVSYNSGAGNEALLKGIPVFSTSDHIHKPTYEEFAVRDFGTVHNPLIPQYFARQDYFNRLAYSQWKGSELETAKLWDFYINEINEWRNKCI